MAAVLVKGGGGGDDLPSHSLIEEEGGSSDDLVGLRSVRAEISVRGMGWADEGRAVRREIVGVQVSMPPSAPAR